MVHSNRRRIPEMNVKEQKRHNDLQIKYCKNIFCMKWMENRSVLMVGSNVENIWSVSSVFGRKKLLRQRGL